VLRPARGKRSRGRGGDGQKRGTIVRKGRRRTLLKKKIRNKLRAERYGIIGKILERGTE